MDESTLYEHIAKWLIEDKGCQSEEFFYGYAIDTEIPHKRSGKRYRPDVVGVRYERRDTKTPSYNFHFHIVEAKAGTEPHHIQNVIGEIANLRQHVEHAVLAADTITWFVGLPTIEVPNELRNWAKENNVGILAVESTADGHTHVREILAAEPKDMGIKRSEFVSNTSQRSPGNFCKAVQNNTSVLKRIMRPKEFFDNRLRSG